MNYLFKVSGSSVKSFKFLSFMSVFFSFLHNLFVIWTETCCIKTCYKAETKEHSKIPLRYLQLCTPTNCFFFAVMLCSGRQNTSLYHKTWSSITRVSIFWGWFNNSMKYLYILLEEKDKKIKILIKSRKFSKGKFKIPTSTFNITFRASLTNSKATSHYW